MKLMEMMEQNSDFFGMLVKKLAPPLVTLLSTEPEIQYVALRNINLIVQKRYFLHEISFLFGLHDLNLLYSSLLFLYRCEGHDCMHEPACHW